MNRVIARRVMFLFVTCLLFIGIVLSMYACSDKGVFVIQYTDEIGVHSIEVKNGDIYSIEAIPEKYGYDFVGLFDAEIGGTQYVSSTGSALAPFSDKKNLILFPQFKAKEFVLMLDYQGAPVVSSRSLAIAYDAVISDLPLNLTKENYDFMGWFTEPNCGGTQIADIYGVDPLVSKFNKDNFDIPSSDNRITLYAGFELVSYVLTCYLDNNTMEKIEVKHGTSISKVITDTKLNNLAVLSWSTTKNDVNGSNVFTGAVTSDMVLYAYDWAPFIEFDTLGGESVSTIVAKSGSSVTLTASNKAGYYFDAWVDTNNVKYYNSQTITMPETSLKLTASYLPLVVLDENGGNDLEDIIVTGGSALLPTPVRDGYTFAGWFDVSNNKYINYITNVTTAINLKAGWYKNITENKVITSSYDGNRDRSWYYDDNQPHSGYHYCWYTLDLPSSDSLRDYKLEWSVELKSENVNGNKACTSFVFSRKQIGLSYQLDNDYFYNVNTNWKTYSFTSNISANDDIYIAFASPKYTNVDVNNLSCTITYPDTSVLY